MGCGASRSQQDGIEQVEPPPAAVGVTATVTIEETQPEVKQSSKGTTAEAELTGTTMVKAWVADADGTLCFPEIDDPEFAIPVLESNKLPLAICISGGGFRAATLGLGWLRALHILGVLRKAKYLCTCSGSSWLSSALSFQRLVPLDDFLGPHLSPEQCTPEALNDVGQKGRSAAAVLADAEPLRVYFREMAGDLVDLEGEGDGEEGAAKQARSWSKAMAGAFLQPYGLGDTDQSTVTISGTKGGVDATVAVRAAKVGRGNVFTADLKALPFPIIAQVIMLARERLKYFPLEWTPLYSGCPVRCSETSPKLGAGWVETMGLNTHLVGQPEPAECLPKGRAVHVRVRPAGPASLGEAIGISSAYNAYKWALGKSRAGRTLHRALGFNTAQYFDQQDWSCSPVELADGGGVDYLAFHPALRRRVRSVIVCSATRTAIGDPKFAVYMKELAGLFGCWPGEPKADKDKDTLPADEYNKLQQVFAPEGFAVLHQALKDAAQAGLPPVHVQEYEVLDNAALGIRGGWRVRVMWVINDVQPQWEAALPNETRELLEGHRNGLLKKVEEALNPLDADTLREFPHVSTFAMNYTPQLVSLMAHHAANMIMGSQAALQGLLSAAAAAAGEPATAAAAAATTASAAK
ncbi:hypothetical protein PLESTB_001535000 [Pleodorina starrii]|uniref:PLA2c domain-containing protein n=1 Tax=Pleodorina starrii TaxID=330485 RepID=A0A9W6BXQ5_9CHLO|nr:hypothetical protein PLESTM_001840400 [Pleodorina starrii]GLC59780.1 hypothetical protein PLESTB_001535000 [Pleodorina starrii]